MAAAGGWLSVLRCPLLRVRIGTRLNRRGLNRPFLQNYCRMLPHGSGSRGQALSASWGRFGACDGRLPLPLWGGVEGAGSVQAGCRRLGARAWAGCRRDAATLWNHR